MPPYSQDSDLAAAASASAQRTTRRAAGARTTSTTTTTTTTTRTANNRPQPPPPLERTVASGMVNLGNTCYMNAVLQALAHCPELGMAMDMEPHSASCPIGCQQSNTASSSSSSSSTTLVQGSGGNGNTTTTAMTTAPPPRALPTRKSTRNGGTGKKSPSPPPGSNNHSNNGTSSDDASSSFCALCEVEHYLRQVHSSTSRSTSTAATTSTSSTMDTRQQQQQQPVAPSAFVHGFIEHVAPWFKLGVQEDSHEFLRLLIDAMQKSCARARLAHNTSTTTTSTTSTLDKATQSKNDDSKQDDDDPEYPFQLFRGTVESNVQCESCLASSSTIDPIEDIGLDVSASSSVATTHNKTYGKVNIPQSSSSSSSSSLADVSYAFSKFNAQEILEGYKCEKCGKVGKATKQSRLHSIPPILTLQLKRFRYGTYGTSTFDDAGTGTSGRSASRRSSEISQLLASSGSTNPTRSGSGSSSAAGLSSRESHGGASAVSLSSGIANTGKSGSAKIEGHVKFEQFFDLRPYLTLKLQEAHKSMFCRLFCVIVHAGANSHSGHYIAYVRNVTKNEWWKMDDARVSRVAAEEVLAAEAYMLFYRAVEHPICASLREKHSKWLAEQRKQQQQQNQETTGPATLANGSNTQVPPPSSSLKRKREMPEYLTGEDWALAMLRMPVSQIRSFVRRAQEFIADRTDLTPDYFARIEDAGRRDRGAPTSLAEDDVQGGKSQFSQGLLDLLFTICEAVGDSRNFFNLTDSTDKEHRPSKQQKPTLIAPPVADANEALL